MRKDRSTQRGVALAYVAIFMVVILGFTVLGIDVARLAFTASEVQAVADTSARGGAVALFASTSSNGDGITRGKFIGHQNFMNGAVAPTGDVLVDEGFWDSSDNKFECCGTAAHHDLAASQVTRQPEQLVAPDGAHHLGPRVRQQDDARRARAARHAGGGR